VVAETYLAEAVTHLSMKAPGRGWSKRSRADRVAQAPYFHEWSKRRGVDFTDEMRTAIDEGFERGGDDAFDSAVGLCSILDVIMGYRKRGAPPDRPVCQLEGWILGQAA